MFSEWYSLNIHLDLNYNPTFLLKKKNIDLLQLKLRGSDVEKKVRADHLANSAVSTYKLKVKGQK